MTAILARNARSVTAVELDRRLLPILESELASYDNVRVICGDMLDIDPIELMGPVYKVVANVPYYITGAIMRRLLTPDLVPTVMVLTVQKEVAERLTAKPGKMSVLAVSVQARGEVSTAFTVSAGSFWPKPEVDSAVILFRAHEETLLSSGKYEAFMGLVRSGFSSKRKQLQKNLRAVFSNRNQLTAVLQQAGIDGKRRAETLSIEEWLSLFSTVYSE